MLGYPIAGIVIGPFGLSLIDNVEAIIHFTEFGNANRIYHPCARTRPFSEGRLDRSLVTRATANLKAEGCDIQTTAVQDDWRARNQWIFN